MSRLKEITKKYFETNTTPTGAETLYLLRALGAAEVALRYYGDRGTKWNIIEDYEQIACEALKVLEE